MISAFFKAVGQFFDPKFQKVLWLGLLTSLFVLAILIAVTDNYLSSLEFEGAEWWWGWLETIADWGWIAAAGLVLFFLYQPVAITIMGMFLDDVCEAVEHKHYPMDTPGKEISLLEGLFAAAKLALLILTVNVVLLPLWIILLFFPPAFAVFYYSINGYFIGREYFELVSWRHMDRVSATRLRKRNSMRVTLTGAMMAFLFTIPIVNLLVPLLAAAMMMHVFKGLERHEQLHA